MNSQQKLAGTGSTLYVFSWSNSWYIVEFIHDISQYSVILDFAVGRKYTEV